MTDFKTAVCEGIPSIITASKPYAPSINHAPKRKWILNKQEKQPALKNALRYCPKEQHAELAPEFAKELEDYGRIYMYRYRPD